MPKVRRKGKTFVTEHYIKDQKTLDALNDIMVAWIGRESEKDSDRLVFRIQNASEISVWAEPQGVFCAFGHSSPNSHYLIGWDKIGVDDETIATALIGLKDLFLEHGKECPSSHSFKVILNESTFHDIMKMFST